MGADGLSGATYESNNNNQQSGTNQHLRHVKKSVDFTWYLKSYVNLGNTVLIQLKLKNVMQLQIKITSTDVIAIRPFHRS